ncbi:transcriptional repressor TCF25-domain-containing protein [Collybia nuda]|uniref:Transcriptional repressor TCF25-domain-containing protein n=1 Tax=Collybia nuda TaxID=64659 RepID=A0A9P6CDV5_9AGAR|nr:transcriptional repressor TCF25-domain-containing protein [Collybia nuda]
MPPRLNKRQQRELEELEALGGRSDSEVSSEDEAPVVTKNAPTGFSSLLVIDDIEDDSEDEGSVKPAKSRKKKKKKKTASPEVATAVSPPGTPKPVKNAPMATPPVKNEKKALKKARAREKKAVNDELDKALAELSIKYPESQTSTSNGPNAQSLANLLSVSLTHLDSEAEMRKFFGAKVVQANKSGSSGASGSSSRRQATTQRSNLTRPQSTWWPASQREGLSIRPLTDGELESRNQGRSDEKWWTVEFSKRYKSATKAFIRSVMAGDPEAFWEILRKLPWHADTLLQLSEVYRHREEYAQAVDFVDRAIFTYERAFIGAFNFTSGTNRLDFDHVENRPFFLAVHRQITDLQRRGCVRTAFEFARLLYALDPWNDPHGSLYHLDQLALKAGMNQWLLDIYELFVKQRVQRSYAKDAKDMRMDPSVLPGWAYARALALRSIENSKKDRDHTASTNALKEAVTSFPMVVPLLADKIDVSLPTAIRSHRDFRIETDGSSLGVSASVIHLLSHLYVQRSFGIWKEPSHASWFTTTVTDVFSTLPSTLPVTKQREELTVLLTHENIRYSAYRHIIVLEGTYQRLFAFMPRTIGNAKGLACDPLPPPAATTTYDDDFFQGTGELVDPAMTSRRQRVALQRRMEQAIPDAAFRQQFQAFFEAHPQLAEQFPGGILQFMQMINQLPPEAVEDILLGAGAGIFGAPGGGEVPGHGEMPGQMPGFEGQMREDAPADENPDLVDEDNNWDEGAGEDEDEDEDEDEEDVSPMPRILRNILGRFWGRAPVDDSSSDDDDNEVPRAPVDDTGVD